MTDLENREGADVGARDGETASAGSSLQDATQVAQVVVAEPLDDATPAPQPVVPALSQVVVGLPGAGQTTRIVAEGGVIYVMNFDPNEAQVVIQGEDFILVFTDGSRIVFSDLVALAEQGQAPLLQVSGFNIGGDVILAQARALALEEERGPPTLETAADAVALRGSGVTAYDDDFGSLISVLSPEGPIPFTLLEFGGFISEIEPIDDAEPAIAPPNGTLLVNPDGPPVVGIIVVPPEGVPPGEEPPEDVPPEFPPGSDPRAFGEGEAASFLSEDITSFALLTAMAPEGVLVQIVVRDLPTSAIGWTVNTDALVTAVTNAGGTVDLSGVDQGTITITFPNGAGVTSFQAPIGLTPPTNSDVDFPGVDVLVTAEPVGGGTPVQGGTLDILIPVDAIVDGTEILVAGQVIPDGAFLVGNLASITTDLQLTIDPFDQTSIAGAAGDADAPFTQGQGDMFDGSEQVTQIVVTLSVADNTLGLPILNFTLPGGISASGPVATSNSVTTTFTVAQGTDFSAVQALVDSLTVTRPDPTFAGTIQVGVETTTVETDPDGLEPNPDNNVDVDSYAFAVTFTPVPNAQFVVENVLGVIPEDTQTGISIQANIPLNCVDVVVTEILVTNLPTAASGWTFDISAIEAFVAGLAGTNSVVFDEDAGTLLITFDIAAGVDDFSQQILALPPANSDVDILDLSITATATNIVSGETTDADPFVDDVVVDAVVDGSEVTQLATAVAATGTTTPVSLELDLTLGSDSTVGGSPGETPFEAQGGTDVDGSESITQITITLTPDDPAGAPTLDWDTTILAETAPEVTVTPQPGGAIEYIFDTSGLSQDQVEALVASFGVVAAATFVGNVVVDLETVLAEAASAAGGGSVPNDSEVFDGDNEDTDQYQFQVVYRDVPNGNLEVLGAGGAFIPEDTPTPAQVSAAVADPAAGDVLTEIRIEQLPTTADGWTIDVSALDAAVTALGGSLAFDAASGTIVITFETADGVTDLVADAAAAGEVANILLTPPVNSDEDFPGVDVIVTATDVGTGFTLTGGTDDIPLVVDAIVDGTEVQQGGANIPVDAEIANTGVTTDLGLSITDLQDSTSLTGVTNPDPNADFTQGGGDTDGSETVTQVVVALSVADGSGGLPSLQFSLQTGISGGTPAVVGNTVTYTFTIADGTSIGTVNALFESFAVQVPSADFDQDVSVDITTTTTETALNGDEPNLADNEDVDSYSLTVSFAGTPNGNLNVLGAGGAFIPEDTQTPAQLTATVADPSSDEVLTEIRIEELPTPSDDWAIDVSPLEAAVNALGGTLIYDAASGTITITFDVADGVTDLVADAAAAGELTNILLTPPVNSDEDFPGVDVIVTATDSSSGVTATGRTDDITLVVDAIVDGTEVLGNDMTVRGSQANGNDIPLTNLGLSITNLQDSTSETGTTNPDPDAAFTQGGGDVDGSETVTQIVVTLTPTNLAVGLPSLGFGVLPTGITVDDPNGVTSAGGDSVAWTFTIEPGTDIALVDQLVQNLAVDPPADFSGDIITEVQTTTTETGLPTSGAEPNPADNTDVDSYTFRLTVDPVPLPQPDPFDVNEAPNVNLTFVIDHSSSMGESSGVSPSDVTVPQAILDIDPDFATDPGNLIGGDYTRLALTKIALVELLVAYQTAGLGGGLPVAVNVLLIEFDATANVISDGNADAGDWFDNDISGAIAAILGIDLGFGTNYVDAVATTIDTFQPGNSPPPDADQQILYFLSDGKPSTRDGTPPFDEDDPANGLNAGEVAAWEAFLSDNLMQALAVGIGEGVADADEDLEDIAVPNDPFDDNPLIVLDEQGLIPTLLTTVNNQVSGNVLDNDLFGPDGQGTPAITQIVVDGTTYTFDGTDITNQSTSAVIPGAVLAVFTALGGRLTFFFDDASGRLAGDFDYIAPQVAADSTETFAYTIQDSDGDLGTANLMIEVRDQTAPPQANNDSVITNDSSVAIADAWLVFNDVDPQGDTLGVAAIDNVNGGTVPSGGFAEIETQFNFAGFPNGEFTYQAHDFTLVPSAEATVDLTLVAGSTLSGSGSGDILIGGSAPDNINGGGGADVLVGNGAGDVLDGGGGNDLLIGGPGADVVIGGAGSDTFQVVAGEPGMGVDNFTDFDLTEDVVDLAQLLTQFESGQDLNEFVRLSSGDNRLAVDEDGGGDSFTDLAVFNAGVTVGETLTVIVDQDGSQATVNAV